MKKFLIFGFVILLFSSAFASYPDKLVGSKKSDKYHYSWCVSVKKIKPENLIIFDSPEAAANYGYQPCKICNPPRPNQEKQ